MEENEVVHSWPGTYRGVDIKSTSIVIEMNTKTCSDTYSVYSYPDWWSGVFVFSNVTEIADKCVSIWKELAEEEGKIEKYVERTILEAMPELAGLEEDVVVTRWFDAFRERMDEIQQEWEQTGVLPKEYIKKELEMLDIFDDVRLVCTMAEYVTMTEVKVILVICSLVKDWRNAGLFNFDIKTNPDLVADAINQVNSGDWAEAYFWFDRFKLPGK